MCYSNDLAFLGVETHLPFNLSSQSCSDAKSFCNNMLSAWLVMVRKSRLSSVNSFVSDNLTISGMSLM